jgi:hypothetical protein
MTAADDLPAIVERPDIKACAGSKPSEESRSFTRLSDCTA